MKNDSLEVPSGVEGIVIDTQRFSRRASMTEDEKKAFDKEQKEIENAASTSRSPSSSATFVDELGRGRSTRRS